MSSRAAWQLLIASVVGVLGARTRTTSETPWDEPWCDRLPRERRCVKTATHPSWEHCAPHPGIEATRIGQRHIWEPDNTAAVRNELRAHPKSTLLDVGARSGWFSMLGLSLGHRVLAVEASSRTICFTQQNALRNNFTGLATVNRPVADVSGIPVNLQGINVKPVSDATESTSKTSAAAASSVLYTLKLDALIPLLDAREELVIQMDIESYECYALRGASKLLDHVNVAAVIMEWTYFGKQGCDFAPVAGQLQTKGLQPFLLVPYGRGKMKKIHGNFTTWSFATSTVMWLRMNSTQRRELGASLLTPTPMASRAEPEALSKEELLARAGEQISREQLLTLLTSAGRAADDRRAEVVGTKEEEEPERRPEASEPKGMQRHGDLKRREHSDGRPAILSGAETSTKIFHAPPGQNFSVFAQLVDRYISTDDRRAFEAATGTSVTRLLELTSAEIAQGSLCKASWEESTDLLTVIMGTDRLVFHRLNRYGLHPLRALLSERILDEARNKLDQTHPPDQRSLVERMKTDGILIIPHIDKLLNTSVERLYTARDGYVARLFESISGYSQPCCGRGGDMKGKGAKMSSPRGGVFTSVRPFVFHHHDTQIYMHTDAYNPTWKVWVFARTTMNEGPFHYVYGSHRNTEGKLRWLFERTSKLSSRAVIQNQTGNANHGPFREHTHTFQSALRFLGFDPAAPLDTTSAAELRRHGFPQPTPIVTKPGGLTLVIADTSGLHYRGVPRHGAAARYASRFNSLGGGCGYCIPRKNPFMCALHPSAC
jgi:FkbM family methyltransferase